MSVFFFFNDTATTEIYTLSLHDALPISAMQSATSVRVGSVARVRVTASLIPESFADENGAARASRRDRKSTRLNSSHLVISYAVFCLKQRQMSPPSLLRQMPCPRVPTQM